ncbi:hypothetical protein BGZ82_002844 [Podila clonocystis]|nr:hypothetical protein BGZ82_002844 [Podila clonocystis]
MSAPAYTIPVPPIDPEDFDARKHPRVLISGGGIGGLTLAILLHNANVPFLVLERASVIKPLGSALSLGCHIAPLFKQLGIYDEFVTRAKEYNAMSMLTEGLDVVNTMEFDWLKKSVGYPEYLISRPELYDLLWRQIPRERILLGKKILSFTQNSEIVLVRCSDGSAYYGNILVGADGAYSATEVLDPEEFPDLKKELAQFHTVLGVSTMCTWITMTTKQNTVCWMVIHFLDKDSSKRNDSFRNSEWGPEEAEALAREVLPFPIPGGRDGKPITLGEFVERTPRQQMSKVMLEEIVFDTWYGGRTVLLGDACHKMNPTGGAGAINAIHDAVTLANWLSTLQSAGAEEVRKVFKEYHAERYPLVKDAFVSSQMFTKNLGKNMMASIVRGMIKRIPLWLWRRMVYKMNSARSQASFLPLIEDKAKVGPLYQRSLHKTLAIRRDLAQNARTI